MNSWPEILTALASVATACGVFLAAYQIWSARKQDVTRFEDSLTSAYRSLAAELPLGALLGEELGEEEHAAQLHRFYDYFDLSNEQVFLRVSGRVSRRTWLDWQDGLRSNLRRPAFNRAWQEIKKRSNGDFGELRRLEESGFNDDPRRWRGFLWRLIIRRPSNQTQVVHYTK